MPKINWGGSQLDMPFQRYRDTDAISQSQLKWLQKSPLHYWSRFIDPARIEVPLDTPALRFGTATHTAVLEPDRFQADYALGPQATKSSKAWKDAVAATDKILLTPDEYAAIQGMSVSLLQHDAARKALFDKAGKNEQSFFFQLNSGLKLKCRADRILSNGIIVDLKTTADASASAFSKSCANFGYHIQAAFYIKVIELVTGVEPKGFAFVAVEKEPPYAVQVFKASDAMICYGMEKVNELLNDLRLLYEIPGEGPWPSYSAKAVELDLPTWATR